MSLKRKTISGIGWNSAGNVARQILQLVTMVVMARLLDPADFGDYAILMVFITFMEILGSMGTAQVIVHMDDPDERMLSSIFYLNLMIGFVLTAVLYLLAWPLAEFFGNTELATLLQAASIIFVLFAFTLVQRALLEKQMLFKRVVITETIAFLTGSLVGIWAAYAGLGVYSLLLIALTNALVLSVGLWVGSHWRPRLKFSASDIKVVWHYTLDLAGFNMINYFARNADTFLIGKFIGPANLGLYNVAYKIMLYPLQNISRVIVRVLFPAFSLVKHDNHRFRQGYCKAMAYIALVTFPLMLGLFSASESFIKVVFGDKWTGMAALLMILAPIGMMQSIVTTVGSIYTAKGTTRLMFKVGTLNAIVTVASFVIGLPFGVKGVAVSYLIANLVMLYPNLKLSWAQIDLGLGEGLSVVAPFFGAALFMSIVVYFTGRWLDNFEMADYLILLVQVIIGAFLYVGSLLWFCRPMLSSMIKEFSRK